MLPRCLSDSDTTMTTTANKRLPTLTVATDGSCLKNPGGAIGWAWADEKGRWQANGLPAGTNQTAELFGLISVLIAFPNRDLHLQLDSQYAMNIASKWLQGWKRNNWKTAGGKPVANLEHVKFLDILLQARKQGGWKTTYEWVKGHNGHGLNEVCDVQAQLAARKAKAGKAPYADSAGNAGTSKQEQLTNKFLPLHS